MAAEKSKTRARFTGYAVALQQFRHTYANYPKFLQESGRIDLPSGDNSELFMQTLSGRDADDKHLSNQGNIRAMRFYSFAESEYVTDEKTGLRQIVDAFGNPHIVIVADHDGDGFVEVPVNGKMQQVETGIAIYNLPLNPDEFVSTYP